MTRSIHTLAAMREAARRRLPRIAFDFIDGAAGREAAMDRAEAAFAQMTLLPQVLTGVTVRSGAAALFGRTYDAPFGVAPIGLADLAWPGTDLALARAAFEANIPYVLSTAGSTTIEEIVAVNPDLWFQLYVGEDQAIVDDLIARAARAGVEVLVVTVDLPAPGKRVRDLANGFTLPLRLTARSLVDLALHPAWCAAVLKAGSPRVANFTAYAGEGAGAQSLAALMAKQSSARLDWSILEEIRAGWRGRLVVKGILNPQDAERARQLGADAVVVSSHGGRQFDAAPAPLAMLPLVREAVGPEFPVLMDGGIRTGEDIAKAMWAGADFVLVGRPFPFSVAALGLAQGPRRVVELLQAELMNALAQLGASSPAELRQRSSPAPADRAARAESNVTPVALAR